MSKNLTIFRILIPVAILLLNGCVYFNTYFNAQKAYDQAMRLHDKRFDKNPEDSILVSAEEKVKLERCIAKASKVLELYPNEKKYQPKALFLIGESYLAMGEYAKAILKYDELQRFYPQAEEMKVAEFHRAKALFLNGQYPFARTALEKVLNSTQDPRFRAEVLVYLAQLEVKNDSPAAALDLYEKLLKEQANSPEAKAQVRLEAARLAYQLKQWERARNHAIATEIKFLPSKLHYRAQTLAADCLYRLKKTEAGISEFQVMLKNRLYASFFPEINLKLAEGFFQIGKPNKAIEILTSIPKNAPKTPFAAEAFYRLGEHQLMDLKNEKAAKVFFDSAAAAGSMFEYAIKAQDRSQALAKLAEYRTSKDTTASRRHYRDFMIAELFLFKLDNLDSALQHLDLIVQDPKQDSNHSMRAAYARAFIQEEFKKSKVVGDSLYKYVLEKYPNTEYAKQAERNLGLKPSVQTLEDEAHKLFLEAEALRFSGGNLTDTVIPAYAKVVTTYGRTKQAAQAQFVIAMIYDQLSQAEEKVAGSRDSAIASYVYIREQYPQTVYYRIADGKLAAAGIKPKPKAMQTRLPPPASAGVLGDSAIRTGSADTGSVNTKDVTPSSGANPDVSGPSSRDGHSSDPSSRGQGDYEGGVTSPDPGATIDSTNYQPEGKTKEELDNGYENVEQY